MASNPFPPIRFLSLALVAAVLTGCVHYEARPVALEKTASAFETRSLAGPEVREFLASKIGRDFMEWPPPEWDLEMLTWVAFHFHPSLDVARAQWDVAQGGIRTAAGRPNPTIGFTPGYNLNAVTAVSPWIPGTTIDVPIETAGKRGKRIAQSRQLAEAAHQNVFTAAWLVRAELRRALLDATAADRRGHALRELATLQQRTVELLEQRRQAGAVSILDVSNVRVAFARAEADAGAAERMAATTRSRLAQALGVPLAALAGQRFADPFADPASVLSVEGLAVARRQCLQSRPDILAALASYEASQAGLQLEIAKQYPDLHLGSGYQWDQGANKWNLALTLELPILNRNQGPIAEAQARRREAATQVVAAQARVIAELDAAQADMAASAAQIDGLEKVGAALQRQADLVHQQLEAGGADRLEEQGAQLELAVGRLALLDARTKAVQAAGLLEDALRIPFANLRSVETDPRPPAQSQNP
jgi:cobalt-zinc-cadmium efflux system outer membrane protein